MIKMKITKIMISVAIATSGLMLGSCSAPKDVTYFQDAESVITLAAQQPIKVRPEDKLAIVVKSKDPVISDMFNLPTYNSRVGQNSGNSVNGTGVAVRTYSPNTTEGIAAYTVNKDGCIDFPVLGNLKIAGMTRNEVAAYIKGELMGRDLVKDPTVTVEFINTGINVIGEVGKPGRYDINKDHLTIVDAMALAGDLAISGSRKDVKVLRENDGKIDVYTLDLTNLGEMVKSPAYYLQQNDVVYVQPNDMRKRQTTVNGNNALSAGFWISVASLITTAVTTIGVFVK